MIVPTTPPTPTRDDLERVSAELAERAVLLARASRMLSEHLARAPQATPEAHAQVLRRVLGMVRSLDDEGLVRISAW